ncbi:oxidoreductase [Bacteroidetes/Chlorobi group bacterium Naka2016]|jgi:polar amino acid transport system substrate-binding protein|nr:MAG: oxidoreductase [Bacteroidetes/Chlorobi group bacterium Naka2016]
MLQVLQHQKSGEILVADVPPPICPQRGILVQNYFSVISSGTERTSVETAKSSLIERAKRQPEQVRTVIDNLKKEGLTSTLNKVFSRLDSYKTFGYSSAGVVIESKSEHFSPGDKVACAGAGYATHSEIVAIPQNLACKIPQGVSFESAAFTTIGSIALQGIRQANPRLGEYVAVIGLGLIGLITVQLLKANGCLVAGLDVREDNFALARTFGCNFVGISSTELIPNLMAFSNGMGFDSVIITASTSSNEPTELALKIARKKGRVIVVGAVGMNIPRSPFYEKEIEFTIACSYGPGRYDKNYEEYGIDYPYAYVRWTENRNMQAFLELIRDGKIDVSKLITHKFPIEQADKAYAILSKPDEKHIAILLEYPQTQKAIAKVLPSLATKVKKGKIKLGFIGAGNFAQFNILPVLKNLDVEFHTVSTATPTNAVSVAKHFGFKYSTTDSLEIIHNPEIDVIFIASRHNTHAQFVIESIKYGKPVFVEKPLCIAVEELKQIEEEYYKNPVPLMVGFNRRFSKPFQTIKQLLGNRTQPIAMHYRVNAGFIPSDHWIQKPELGGGRIIGEVCHFVDTMMYLTDSHPKTVYAESLSHQLENTTIDDTTTITIKFEDGSIGVIEYFANGNKNLEKEYFEVFSEGTSIVLNNFENLSIYTNNGVKKKKFDGSKGHREEIEETVISFSQGKSPLDFSGIKIVTLTTFAIVESLRSGKKIYIKDML